MNKNIHLVDLGHIGLGLALAAAGAIAHAQSPSPAPASSGEAVIYPSKGQDAKQQDMDRYQCFDWARGQSGFDPTRQTGAAPALPTVPPTPGTAAAPATSTARTADPTGGMARGAIGGAAIGELAHRDVGQAAAAGALGGGLMTRMKDQQGKQQQQQLASQQQLAAQQQAAMQQAAQQQSARGQQKATYDRAFGACMEGRGYTVR